MERLIKTLGDGLDRRSFFRKLGKLGMGAAAIAGVLLLPKEASAGGCAVCTNPNGDCGASAIPDSTICRKQGFGICRVANSRTCRCYCDD